MEQSPLATKVKYGLWVMAVAAMTVLLFLGISQGATKLTRLIKGTFNVASVVEFDKKQEPLIPEPFKILLGNISDKDFIPPSEGKMIRVNLETMRMYLYENGTLRDTLTVVGKGKEGSYWETPGGEYKVLYKEEQHFSSTGKVWMPYSMQFFGNYFIHGWPYYPNGQEVAAGFSGGCIRLKTEDAKKVFEWADRATRISIYSDSENLPREAGMSTSYFLKNPKQVPVVSAESYVVGDLDTGEIILEKNMEDNHPIASVTKLMTSIVSLDVVNQQITTTVSEKALSTYGINGNFRVGEKIPTKELIYPLLLESSNDAAEIIAETLGRPYFLDQMNKKAQAIGMQKTSYQDPSGLSDNNRSTALDLFRLASYINKYKNFIWDVTLKDRYTYKQHAWYSNNQFLHQAGYTGGKSGYIDSAKETVVGTFLLPLSEFNTRHIAITLLRSDDRYKDTESLLSYIKKNLYYGQESGFAVAIPEPTPPAPPEPPKREDIVMTFVGDIMLDRGVKQSVTKNFKGDFNELFKNVEILKEADITFANLEGPISDKGKDVHNLYSFRMDPIGLEALKTAGFGALSIANNHIGDWGYDAYTDTLTRIKNANMIAVGGDMNKKQAETPKIIEKNGIKIGFLGFSDVGPTNLEAGDNQAGILLASDPRLEEIITNASKQVDNLVVSFHFGAEYEKHNERQELLAKKAIDAGAKLIIGHHPHVVQDVIRYKNGLIVYSLGNFIFDQPFSEATMQGLMVTVKMNKKGEFLKIDKNIVKLNKTFQPEKIIRVREN